MLIETAIDLAIEADLFVRFKDVHGEQVNGEVRVGVANEVEPVHAWQSGVALLPSTISIEVTEHVGPVFVAVAITVTAPFFTDPGFDFVNFRLGGI